MTARIKEKVVPIIDKILATAISKKLTVFFIATFFLYLDKLQSEQWENIAIVYLCSQGTIDVFIKILEARKKKDEPINEVPDDYQSDN